MNALYDIYYVIEKILNRVQDVNESRVLAADVDEKRWVFPTIPTSTDNSYPRLAVQISNVEEFPVSAGAYISDTFQDVSSVKKETQGKLYYITIWIGLYVKRELPSKIAFPDGSVKLAKNTLLGNLLFNEILNELDKGAKDIKTISYNYRQFDKEISLGYEDDTNRIIYEVSLKVPMLSTIDIVYNEAELIETITKNYNTTT